MIGSVAQFQLKAVAKAIATGKYKGQNPFHPTDETQPCNWQHWEPRKPALLGSWAWAKLPPIAF